MHDDRQKLSDAIVRFSRTTAALRQRGPGPLGREAGAPSEPHAQLHRHISDEYFLSNVKTVDEVTESMRARVSCGGAAGSSGARALDAAVGTWPGLSVAAGAAGAGGCRACARSPQARLLLYGQPYNPATLEPVQPDARLAYEKVCTNSNFTTNIKSPSMFHSPRFADEIRAHLL